MKNIIPAVASTNALIAAACVNEAFKLLTYSSQTLNTYMMYMGAEGVYTTSYCNERNSNCIVCSDAADTRVLIVASDMLLREFVEQLCSDASFQLKKPSITGHESNPLYMHGPMEKVLRGNLDKSLAELIDDGDTVTITDPTLKDTALSIQLRFQE